MMWGGHSVVKRLDTRLRFLGGLEALGVMMYKSEFLPQLGGIK